MGSQLEGSKFQANYVLPEMWFVDESGGNQRSFHIQAYCKHWHAEIPHQMDPKTPGHQAESSSLKRIL